MDLDLMIAGITQVVGCTPKVFVPELEAIHPLRLCKQYIIIPQRGSCSANTPVQHGSFHGRMPSNFILPVLHMLKGAPLRTVITCHKKMQKDLRVVI